MTRAVARTLRAAQLRAAQLRAAQLRARADFQDTIEASMPEDVIRA